MADRRLPCLNVKSNFLVYLWNIPVGMRGRELKENLNQQIGPVRFIETFEAWNYRPSGHMVVEFNSLASVEFFAEMMAAERIPFLHKPVGFQDLVTFGRRQFFELIYRDTGVDLLGCEGNPPSADWNRQRPRGMAVRSALGGGGTSRGAAARRAAKPYQRDQQGAGRTAAGATGGRPNWRRRSESPSPGVDTSPFPRAYATSNNFNNNGTLRRFLWNTDAGRKHILTIDELLLLNGLGGTTATKQQQKLIARGHEMDIEEGEIVDDNDDDDELEDGEYSNSSASPPSSLSSAFDNADAIAVLHIGDGAIVGRFSASSVGAATTTTATSAPLADIRRCGSVSNNRTGSSSSAFSSAAINDNNYNTTILSSASSSSNTSMSNIMGVGAAPFCAGAAAAAALYRHRHRGGAGSGCSGGDMMDVTLPPICIGEDDDDDGELGDNDGIIEQIEQNTPPTSAGGAAAIVHQQQNLLTMELEEEEGEELDWDEFDLIEHDGFIHDTPASPIESANGSGAQHLLSASAETTTNSALMSTETAVASSTTQSPASPDAVVSSTIQSQAFSKATVASSTTESPASPEAVAINATQSPASPETVASSAAIQSPASPETVAINATQSPASPETVASSAAIQSPASPETVAINATQSPASPETLASSAAIQQVATATTVFNVTGNDRQHDECERKRQLEEEEREISRLLDNDDGEEHDNNNGDDQQQLLDERILDEEGGDADDAGGREMVDEMEDDNNEGLNLSIRRMSRMSLNVEDEQEEQEQKDGDDDAQLAEYRVLEIVNLCHGYSLDAIREQLQHSVGPVPCAVHVSPTHARFHCDCGAQRAARFLCEQLDVARRAQLLGPAPEFIASAE